MTKKKKIALIVTAGVLAAILITVCILAIIAHSKDDKTTPCDELSRWQSMIKDDALLKNVVTPGAHDAGTKGISYLAETQSRNTEELLKAGTRYFDPRVALAKNEYKIYHGPFKGVLLDGVLNSFKQFLTNNPSETLILDFQHFDGDAQEGVWQKTQEHLSDMLLANDTQIDDVSFIDGLTLGQCRGKCLVVWGRENETILANKNAFKRNNDEGTRENSVLHSYYESSLNKKSSKKYVGEALEKYIGEYKKVNRGLFVLQGQLTDGLFVFGPRFKEATHTENMNAYVKALKDSGNLQYIKIGRAHV